MKSCPNIRTHVLTMSTIRLWKSVPEDEQKCSCPSHWFSVFTQNNNMPNTLGSRSRQMWFLWRNSPYLFTCIRDSNRKTIFGATNTFIFYVLTAIICEKYLPVLQIRDARPQGSFIDLADVKVQSQESIPALLASIPELQRVYIFHE